MCWDVEEIWGEVGKCLKRCEKVCWGVGEVLKEVCWGFPCLPSHFPHLLSLPPYPNTLSHTSLQHFPTIPSLLALPPPHPNTLFTPLPTSPLKLLSPHLNTVSHTSPQHFSTSFLISSHFPVGMFIPEYRIYQNRFQIMESK